MEKHRGRNFEAETGHLGPEAKMLLAELWYRLEFDTEVEVIDEDGNRLVMSRENYDRKYNS
jgi:hypothetical protein